MRSIDERVGISQIIREAIIHEKQLREKVAQLDQYNLIAHGKRQEALENLIYFTAPQHFPDSCRDLLQQINADFYQGDTASQVEQLSFLVELALALSSILPRWNLTDLQAHGQSALTQDQVQHVLVDVQELLADLSTQAPAAEKSILEAVKTEAVARYKAEQVADPAGAARSLADRSLIGYIGHISNEIAHSQLRRIAEMRFDGKTATELSNDYAAFLQHTLYLGSSFATTNPPLVNMAWDILPATWDPIINRIIITNPDASAQSLAKLVTLEVVLTQMRLLRPIFLITEGSMGSVCFQVDPNNHADAEAMIGDALFFYEELRSRFGGGIPNVVFKLPGTQAGLEACRALTNRGIGVTITVNFGMFQHIPFAQAILKGHALYACLVEMNGRLAFPVRDELLGKLDELAASGIDEHAAREAAAWAGVIIAKRLHKMLNDNGIDPNRSKILIASLRIYVGEAYQDLPSAFPDITEIVGAQLLSVFPNVRYAFDQAGEMAISPNQIESPVPGHILDILSHSEIFKQAYFVADRGWLTGEDERFKPDRKLVLEDEEGVFNWAPVHNTLVEFINSYNSLVQRLEERMQALLGDRSQNLTD
jgi:transaldolase